MKFLKICTLSIIAFGISTAVATAGIRCDEHAKKASVKKTSSSCATKTSQVSTVSTAKTECTPAEKAACTPAQRAACTTAEKQACATSVKNASAKKVKSGSCCASKANSVKTASIEPATKTAEASVQHVSTPAVATQTVPTPQK